MTRREPDLIRQLQWHPDKCITGTELHYAYTQNGRYVIMYCGTDRSGTQQWSTKREPPHRLLPNFDGYCPSLAAAKQTCETNYPAVIRADLWLDYIRDNDPPTGAP